MLDRIKGLVARRGANRKQRARCGFVAREAVALAGQHPREEFALDGSLQGLRGGIRLEF